MFLLPLFLLYLPLLLVMLMHYSGIPLRVASTAVGDVAVGVGDEDAAYGTFWIFYTGLILRIKIMLLYKGLPVRIGVQPLQTHACNTTNADKGLFIIAYFCIWEQMSSRLAA